MPFTPFLPQISDPFVTLLPFLIFWGEHLSILPRQTMMQQQITKMTEKVRAVAAAALAEGELDGGRRAMAAVWSTEIGALKTAIKGYLLKLKDGTWAYVGFQRALVEKEARPALVVSAGATERETSGD